MYVITALNGHFTLLWCLRVRVYNWNLITNIIMHNMLNISKCVYSWLCIASLFITLVVLTPHLSRRLRFAEQKTGRRSARCLSYAGYEFTPDRLDINVTLTPIV